jgi:hypothetical protein
MSEAMSDVLSNLRDKAPTLPSAKDATDAMRSHLPSVDVDAVRSHLPSRKPDDKGRSKWAMGVMLVGALAAAAAVFRISRRREAPSSPSMYTPPLPKP